MQALKNGRGLAALLLAGGVVFLAAGASHADEAGDAAAMGEIGAPADAETSRASGDDAARSNNQSCLNRFGSDFVRAFNRDRNEEPVNVPC